MALFEELEEAGEVEVRRRLANGGFGYPGTLTYNRIQEWLRLKELERENSRDVHQEIVERENLRIQTQIRNMTIVVLVVTVLTLLLAIFPVLDKFFKPALPVSDIQPHEKDNQPTGHDEGKDSPLQGTKTVEPINHK
jgi:hypothetical protein